jgi:hypothetical protein
MTSTLSRFRIEALHNKHTVDLPITDNKLILIGKNGVGKSAVLNFLYFFLSCQWHKMLPYKFRRVVATIDDRDIEVTKEDLLKAEEAATRWLRMFTPRISNRILDLVATESIEDLRNAEHITVYAAELDLPLSIFIEALEPLLESSTKLHQLHQDLRDLFPSTVLYLPAYRHIGQDLPAVFPEIAASSEFKHSMQRLAHRSKSANYVELVQFGMQDGEETIQSSRKNLVLSCPVNLQKDQQNIRDFVNVCNGYLYEKRLVYDDVSSTITMQEINKEAQNEQNHALDLNHLSSGEKQILSVFSQIYLSDISDYFVIIDDLELSLSIFWQKQFLPDIVNSGRCSGFIVTTHSPFVSENGFDDYMRPLQLYVGPIDGKS